MKRNIRKKANDLFNSLKKLGKAYEMHDEALWATRHNGIYEHERMVKKQIYCEMRSKIEDLIKEMDRIGIECGEVSVLEYHTIKKGILPLPSNNSINFKTLTTMKTKDKAKEIAQGNAVIEAAAMKMANWVIQEVYDRIHAKKKLEKPENIKTDDGWLYYVPSEDVEDILNDLNGTRRIYMGDDEHSLQSSPSASVFDSALKAVGNAQFGHLK